MLESPESIRRQTLLTVCVLSFWLSVPVFSWFLCQYFKAFCVLHHASSSFLSLCLPLLSPFSSPSLSIFLSVYIFLPLVSFLSLCRPFCLSIFIQFPSNYLSVYLPPVSLPSFCLTSCLLALCFLFHLSVSLPVCLLYFPPISLSVSPSVCLSSSSQTLFNSFLCVFLSVCLSHPVSVVPDFSLPVSLSSYYFFCPSYLPGFLFLHVSFLPLRLFPSI